MSERTARARATDEDASNGVPVTSVRHPLVRVLLVLTFTTGLVDAVSYLGLGRVFTANMTGNVVLLGFGIAGSRGLPVLAPLISLGAFLVGAGAGGVLARRVGEQHRAHVTRALGAEVALSPLPRSSPPRLTSSPTRSPGTR